jgi:hypothetical protein
MPKTGSGAIAGAGRRKGEFVGWDEGLTESDKASLQVVADHTDEVIEQLGFAIARSLEAVGIEAESDAARLCPVDTGRLRNSITHTIDGDEPAAVIGTNVEYAIFHELGTSSGIEPLHFLKNAVANHTAEYKNLLKESLKNE